MPNINPEVVYLNEDYAKAEDVARVKAMVAEYVEAINNGIISPSHSEHITKITISFENVPFFKYGEGVTFFDPDGDGNLNEIRINLDAKGFFFDAPPFSSIESLVVHELSHGFYNEHHTDPRDGVFEVKVVNDCEALGVKPNVIDKYNAAKQTPEETVESCFPAGTLITLADGSEKVIEDVVVGDVVMSFGADGVLRGAPVTQLLDNVTDTWLKLSNGTVVTPGHRFLRPDGSFMEIKDIIATDGQIVAEDDSIMTVTAEAIHYSADTAHLFEQHEKLVSATSGATALAPEVKDKNGLEELIALNALLGASCASASLFTNKL